MLSVLAFCAEEVLLLLLLVIEPPLALSAEEVVLLGKALLLLLLLLLLPASFFSCRCAKRFARLFASCSFRSALASSDSSPWTCGKFIKSNQQSIGGQQQ